MQQRVPHLLCAEITGVCNQPHLGLWDVQATNLQLPACQNTLTTKLHPFASPSFNVVFLALYFVTCSSEVYYCQGEKNWPSACLFCIAGDQTHSSPLPACPLPLKHRIWSGRAD